MCRHSHRHKYIHPHTHKRMQTGLAPSLLHSANTNLENRLSTLFRACECVSFSAKKVSLSFDSISFRVIALAHPFDVDLNTVNIWSCSKDRCLRCMKLFKAQKEYWSMQQFVDRNLHNSDWSSTCIPGMKQQYIVLYYYFKDLIFLVVPSEISCREVLRRLYRVPFCKFK